MQIETPEPVTLALMAIGVASIDYRRYEGHKATYSVS